MTESERHFIELVLRRQTAKFEKAAGIDLAARDAKHAKDQLPSNKSALADSAHWWIALAELLAPHGQKFIDETSSEVLAISASAEAYNAFIATTVSYLDFLSHHYEKRYRNNRFFYSPQDHKTVTLPAYWAESRSDLELGLQILERKFQLPGDAPADRTSAAEGIQNVHCSSLLPLDGVDVEIAEAIRATAAKANVVAACRRWLQEIYAADSPSNLSKGDAWTAAIEKWPDGLSHRAFLNAWSGVSKDRSWMTKPGRAPGGKKS